MNTPTGSLVVTLTRAISAPPAEVFDAWMDPALPCNTWHGSEQLILDPRPDRAFYFRHKMSEGHEVAHFGRFTAVDRPARLQYTWMSQYTRGLESEVTVTFEPAGGGTKLTLRHAGLPDDEFGQLHEGGWGHYLGLLEGHFQPAR